MLAHSDDRPYCCTMCPREFKVKSALQAHMTLHTKSGPHRCDKCHKVYTVAATLRKHECAAVKRQQIEAVRGRRNTRSTEQPASSKLRIIEDSDKKITRLTQNDVVTSKEDGCPVKIKTEVDNFKYMCGVCTATFHSVQTVEEHIKSHEEEEFQTVETSQHDTVTKLIDRTREAADTLTDMSVK